MEQNLVLVDLEKVWMVDEKDEGWCLGKAKQVPTQRILFEIEAWEIPTSMTKSRSLIREAMKQKLYEIAHKYHPMYVLQIPSEERLKKAMTVRSRKGKL